MKDNRDKFSRDTRTSRDRDKFRKRLVVKGLGKVYDGANKGGICQDMDDLIINKSRQEKIQQGNSRARDELCMDNRDKSG